MKFGTSGLRGLVTELQGMASFRFAAAFSQYMLSTRRVQRGDFVYIGRDLRPSSPEIAKTCMSAIADEGLQPIDCGEISTPALAFHAMSNGSPCLMITGSHIPADRNGIKFYHPDGEIDKSDEIAILQIADNITPSSIKVRTANVTLPPHIQELYADRYKTLFSPHSLRGLKIGVYQHSTVLRHQLVQIIESYGAQVVELGFSETFVPLDTEAVPSETIQKLKFWSTEHDLNAIVSADGDGDRPLVTDEFGEQIRGDLLGLMAALFLRPDAIVTTITSNSGLERSLNCKVKRTRVGSPHVIAGMNSAVESGSKRVLGFEANGGVLCATSFRGEYGILSPLPTRDCILPMLASLAATVTNQKTLSEIVRELKLPYAISDRLQHFPTEVSRTLMAYLLESHDNRASFFSSVDAITDFNDLDGLRVSFQNGAIIHLRPSGNAPELRCYVEARDAAMANHLLSLVKSLIDTWRRTQAYELQSPKKSMN